ncbi:MAG: hypothetical protein ACI4ET_12610 [Bilifractor sp.]
MAEFVMDVNINAPDLCKSIDHLAEAIMELAASSDGAVVEADQKEPKKSRKTKTKAKAEKETPTSAPEPAAANGAQIQQGQVMPAPEATAGAVATQATAATEQIPAPTPAPTPAQAPVPAPAPVQSQPTKEQMLQKVASAGSWVMDNKGIEKLSGVLNKYGLQSITEPNAEQYYSQILSDLYLLGAPIL